jgi:hypothetical protein
MGSRAQRGLLAVALAALVAACASSRPAPPPPPTDDAAESLVQSLTKFFALDAAQQEKTRSFARELVDRNAAIRAAWDRGEKMRPEMLLASSAKFDEQFTSILTAEQRRKYDQEWRRLMLKGRSVQPGS